MAIVIFSNAPLVGNLPAQLCYIQVVRASLMCQPNRSGLASLERHRCERRNLQLARVQGSRGTVRTFAAAGGKPEGDPTSKAILDAFFLGRALADTINERLGRALGELISEVNQHQAEQREATRQFQDEVKERAQAALLKAVQEASSSGSPSTSATTAAPSPETSQ